MSEKLMHELKKFPSILGKRVYNHAWKISFLNVLGGEIFSLNPYILHGPDPRDNGLSEIKKMAESTRKANPSLKIFSAKLKYLGTV